MRNGVAVIYTTKEFIQKFVCRAGESVEQLSSNEWQIQRWTARTFKSIGNIFAVENYDINPNEEITKLKLRPNTRRDTLPISEQQIEEVLHRGWLIQEVRFMKDGRTPESTVYRMGPGLYAYKKLKMEKLAETDELLKQVLLKEVERTKNILPEEFLHKANGFANEAIDSESWVKERVRKFRHFLIAYLQLRRQKSTMEYKEIGATYYKEIGGSKVFDHYREFFIERLEKWLNAPIHELGIISLGTIVPIFFAGNLTGKYSSYSHGTIHSTTDFAMLDEHFQTDDKILWLVENRAVLTRMAKEREFLQDTGSFVMAVDGQIKGAHRKLIRQICRHSSIEKVLIWVDYDKSGQIIAGNLVNLVKDIPYQLIGNADNVFSTYEAYIKWSKTIKHAEQEMTLGGVKQWNRWIKK